MRALLAAVIVMGVLIVVGTGALVVLVVKRLGGDTGRSDAAVVIREPAGTRVVSAASDGKTLTLILAGPEGQEIEIRDVDSGQVVRRFSVVGAN